MAGASVCALSEASGAEGDGASDGPQASDSAGEEERLLAPPGAETLAVEIFSSSGAARAEPPPIAGAQPKPWFVWPLLAVGVCSVASAGVVFDSMPEVPALLLAGWRLQLTSVWLLPGAAVQLGQMAPAARSAAIRRWWVLAGSGVCLAFHFGCWVWGIQHTTLAHSLLLVSATPLLVVVGSVVLCQPVSAGELWGTILGAVGAAVLALGKETGKVEQVSLSGDLASLAGAAAMVGYLAAGRMLRGAKMPLFVYALPVTGLAAVLLSLASVVLEGTKVFGSGAGGVFGWVAASTFLWKVVYLASGPGLLGHTGFNLLLTWLTPLVISLALTLEPVVGSVLGWALGVSSAPNLSACLGGVMLMCAMLIVTLSTHRREQCQPA